MISQVHVIGILSTYVGLAIGQHVPLMLSMFSKAFFNSSVLYGSCSSLTCEWRRKWC